MTGDHPVAVKEKGWLVDIPGSMRTNPSTGVQGFWLGEASGYGLLRGGGGGGANDISL